jgi:hypothetical protein
MAAGAGERAMAKRPFEILPGDEERAGLERQVGLLRAAVQAGAKGEDDPLRR